MITHFTDQSGRTYFLLDGIDLSELPDDGLDAALSVAETALSAYTTYEAFHEHDKVQEIAALRAVAEQVKSKVITEFENRGVYFDDVDYSLEEAIRRQAVAKARILELQVAKMERGEI